MSHYIIVDTLSHSSSFVNNINLHQAYSLVNFNLVNECVTIFSIIFPKIYNSLHAVNSEKKNSWGNLTDLRRVCSWIITDYRICKPYSRTSL